MHLTEQNSDINESRSHAHDQNKRMNRACLTNEPVNVHNTMLALVFAVASVNLGGMFLRSMVFSAATYLVDMCVPNPFLANMVNENRSPRRIIAFLLRTCIARSWFRSAVATIQSLNFGGISHHG